MKTFKLHTLSFLMLVFFCTSTTFAQEKKVIENDRNTYILIKTGNEKEKVLTETDVDEILHEFNIDVDNEKVHHFMRGHHNARHQSSKAFLGIYSSTHEDGLQIDKVVKNSAAEKAGLQAGDVITSIEGYNIRNIADLQSRLKEYKAGDSINIQYLRGEKKFKQNVELGRKQTARSYSYTTRYERDPCAIFIGVYTGSAFKNEGVRVHGVIDNTPAMEANIQKGDIITAIDGIPVHSHRELKVERDKHSQGDAFEISYIRQGVAQNVTAYFKDCSEEKEAVQEQPVEIVEEVLEDVPTVPAITQPTNNTLQVEGMEAYPNPTFGNLSLRFEAEAKPTTIRVVDVTGRVIFNENLNNFDGVYSRELDVSKGTAGVLSVTITQEGKVFTKNVILLSRA